MKDWKTDIDDIRSISKKKVDFIYDNAIGLLSEIKEGNEILIKRVTMLTSYIATIFAICVATFLKEETWNLLKFITIFISISYCILLYQLANLLLPQSVYPISITPQDICMKDNLI